VAKPSLSVKRSLLTLSAVGSLSSKKPSRITLEKEAVDNPTSIHMVPQKDFAIGVCVVCGQPAILKWHDVAIGLIGDCCLQQVLFSDILLKYHWFSCLEKKVTKILVKFNPAEPRPIENTRRHCVINVEPCPAPRPVACQSPMRIGSTRSPGVTTGAWAASRWMTGGGPCEPSFSRLF
jgi:hypothetical protein